ncbi:transposase, partial [Luteolibacter arcticus]
NERLYIWKKPRQQPDGSGLDAGQWAALPEQLVIRYIKRPYVDRTGRKRTLVVATTLLDTEEYPAAHLCDLYARRWEIELKLRDIKATLGMERFAVASPEMAHKTLWMMMIAYNLIRCVMQQAAAESGKDLVEMSFKGVLDHATASHDSYLLHRGKPRCLARHHQGMMATCGTKLVDIRPGRREPRALKRRPNKYPPLTAPRGVYRDKPNKGKTKRAA